MSIKRNRLVSIDDLIILIISAIIFRLITNYIVTDIIGHTKHVVEINSGISNYPGNFMYYLILNTFGIFKNHYIETFIPSIMLLSIASTMKYTITKYVIRQYCGLNNINISSRRVIIAAVALFFVFSIPDYYDIVVFKKWLLGKFVPMVWHNSTTIFLLPFSIALFWIQYNILNNKLYYNRKTLIVMSTLVLMNAFVKPSFLFVYIPVTTLFIIYIYRLAGVQKIISLLIPNFVGILGIVIVYIVLYILGIGSFQKEESTIIIGRPFEIILSFIPWWHIPISLVTSYLVVIFMFAVNRNVRTDILMRLALSMVVAAIIIAAFIIEDGPRKYHGNFIWQVIPATYILFLSSMLIFVKESTLGGFSKSQKYIIIILYFVHALAGILYVLKIFYSGNYL